MRNLLVMLLLTPLLLLIPASEPIDEISLERKPCFGACPVDKIVIRADRTVLYTGTRHVKRVGKFRGTIDVKDLRELARLVDEKKFSDLEDR